MQILVTGFEPYGGRKINPSHEAMRALDGRTIAGASVIGRGLPVALAPLGGHIDRLLDELSPSAILALGLAPGEPVIRIERLSVNLADFPIADNEGTTVRNMPVVAGGADSYFSTLPVAEIEADLLKAGIPARLSMSAGTYLCNACLYRFREALVWRGQAIPCGFIHLPDVPEQVASSLKRQSARGASDDEPAGLASMELPRMIRAVEIAIATTVRMMAASQ